MVMFVIACVLIGAGLISLVAAKYAKFTRDSAGALIFGVCALALGSVIIVASSYNSVPTRNVGIVTSFNKPTGETTGAGVEWTKPWEDIDDWDASRNTFDRLGDRCLWVSVSGGKACIPVQIEWSAKAENAPEDWAAYKEVDSIAFGTPVYDEATTKAISAYGQKVLESRNLAVDKANADTKAAINAKLAAQNKVTYCLQLAEKLGKEPGLCMAGPVTTRPVS
jgi:hypothetical protein